MGIVMCLVDRHSLENMEERKKEAIDAKSHMPAVFLEGCCQLDALH